MAEEDLWAFEVNIFRPDKSHRRCTHVICGSYYLPIAGKIRELLCICCRNFNLPYKAARRIIITITSIPMHLHGLLPDFGIDNSGLRL
jgi:hypothetical protein